MRRAGNTVGSAPNEVGSFIVTPSEVAAMLKSLKSDNERLNVAWQVQNGKSGNTAEWAPRFDAWGNKYQDINAFIDSDPSTWWGATADQIDTYRADLVIWEKELTRYGADIVGPPIDPPTKTGTLDPYVDAFGSMLTKVMITGIVIAGIVVAVKLVPSKKA